MERIINIASPWIIELQDFLSGIQYTETLGYVLLIADAILSALFTEMLFKGDKIDKNDKVRRPRGIVVEQKKEKPYLKELLLFLGVSILFFFLNICITLLLLWAFFHFVPQKESFDILLMRIYESYNTKFVVPLVATVIAGLALKGVNRNKRWSKTLLCFFVGYCRDYSETALYASGRVDFCDH